MISSSCVPLSECKPYSGVLKAFENQNVVANKTQAEWLAFFSQNGCGFTANEQNIECPVEAGNNFANSVFICEFLHKMLPKLLIKYQSKSAFLIPNYSTTHNMELQKLVIIYRLFYQRKGNK